MRISLMLLPVLAATVVDVAQAGPAPYYVDNNAWMCGSPGNLIPGPVADRNRNKDCMPPVFPKPTNAVVMGIFGQFAFVCLPVAPSEGFPRMPLCDYALMTSIIDKNGKHPAMATLKAYAAKQTMRDVMAIN